MGLLWPESLLALTPRCHPRYASGMAVSPPTVTPDRSHPQESSILSLPESPPRLAPSGPQPLLGTGLAGPCPSHMPIHPGHRQWHPRPLRARGRPPSPSHPHAPGGGELAIPASGGVEAGRPGGMPPERPTTGEGQALPAGTRSSAAPAARLPLGPSARKRCLLIALA